MDNFHPYPVEQNGSDSSSSSRIRVMDHNWSATKQRLHPQSVAEISRHSVLSGDFHPYPVEQRFPAGKLRSVSPAGNRCHFVLLDKNESRPTAELSNIGHANGPAYSTGELLNTPIV